MRETTGERIVRQAEALVGAPFRLHGRDPALGLDCIGVALLALRGAGLRLPEPPPYRLSAGVAPDIAGWMDPAGLCRVQNTQPGDLIFVLAAPMQLHLLIDVGRETIHAHGGIGRVVRAPVPDAWIEVSRWRVAKSKATLLPKG